MAYKAYQPNKPAFKKVKKLKGTNSDNITLEMMASYNHNPYKSIYVKEICDSKVQRGPTIASHSQKDATHETLIAKRSKNKKSSNGSVAKKDQAKNQTLDQLNDNISIHSFEMRNTGDINRMSAQNYNPVGKQAESIPFHLLGGDANPYLDEHLAIDDSEYYRKGWENGRPEAETLLEKNFRSILKQHPTMKAKCLQAEYPIQKASIYKKDFIPMKGERMPAAQGRNDFRPENPIDLGTIHKQDYVNPVKFNVVEPEAGDQAKRRGLDEGAEHLRAPTVKDTQYMNDYPDWGTIPQMKSIRPANPKTVASGMPFQGKQTYKDYGNFDKTTRPDKPNPDRGQRNPLGVDLPFIGDTSYGNYYRPFKVGKGDKGPQGDGNGKAPIKGLYKTTYQDYDGSMNNPDNNRDRPCCTVTNPEKNWLINDTTSRLIDTNDQLLSIVALDAQHSNLF